VPFSVVFLGCSWFLLFNGEWGEETELLWDEKSLFYFSFCCLHSWACLKFFYSTLFNENPAKIPSLDGWLLVSMIE